MSFEVGDRVVCVDDGPGWFQSRRTGKKSWHPSNLVAGTVYTVQAFTPKGARYLLKISGVSKFARSACDVISVGVVAGHGVDAHSASRFRKIERRDISQSLQALKDLALNCPQLVEDEQ